MGQALNEKYSLFDRNKSRRSSRLQDQNVSHFLFDIFDDLLLSPGFTVAGLSATRPTHQRWQKSGPQVDLFLLAPEDIQFHPIFMVAVRNIQGGTEYSIEENSS
jgi:hypothetical protein